MTQLHTYVESRLQRWAAWSRTANKVGPKGVRSWWGALVLDRNVEQIGARREILFEDSECEETDRAVHALPPQLRAAIVEQWLTTATVEQKARRLSCCVQTFYNRIARANHELLGLFNDLAAGINITAPQQVEQNSLTELESFRTFPATVA